MVTPPPVTATAVLPIVPVVPTATAMEAAATFLPVAVGVIAALPPAAEAPAFTALAIAPVVEATPIVVAVTPESAPVTTVQPLAAAAAVAAITAAPTAPISTPAPSLLATLTAPVAAVSAVAATTLSAPSLESAFAAAATSGDTSAQLAMASPVMAKSRTVVVGNPIYGNTGAYLCPFTEDGTVSPWVEKAMKAKLGGQLGGTGGAYLGQQLATQIPLFGSFIGKQVGQTIGREAALQMLGGWAAIRQSTEISFKSATDMAAYLKSQNGSHAQYRQVIEATVQLYPDMAPLLGVATP